MAKTTLALSGVQVPFFGEQTRVPERVELNGFTYYKIKDAILLSPGVHNSRYYPAESIAGAYQMTDWSDKRIRALYVDHKDNEVPAWVGFVDNVRFDGENLIGDLWITDDSLAKKLALGAKFGISPKLSGTEVDGVIRDFVFDNFSIVVTPACKTTYLNSEQKGDVKMEEDKKLEEQPVEEKVEQPEQKEEVKESVEAENEESQEAPEESEPAEESKEEAEEELSDEEILKEFEELKSDYIEFVKKYIKEHPGASVKDAAKAWKKYPKVEEKSEEDKEKKKYPYPYPEEYKKKLEELEEKINKIVSELSEKVESIEKKIEEPEIKSEPLVETPKEENKIENADEAILNILKQM